MNGWRLARRLAWALWSRRRLMGVVLPGVAVAAAHGTMLDVPAADFVDALDSDKYRIQWVFGGYLVGSAAGLALTRFVGDRIGLSRGYVLGMTLFAVFSAACAIVSETVWMAPLRIVQGLGNGLLISAGMVLLWQAFPRQREFAMALYGMAIFAPAVAGAVIGGLIVAAASWRWVFLLNLPLGAVNVFAALAWLRPTDRGPREALAKFDFVGFALLLSWVASLNVTLDMGQYWGWFTSHEFLLWASVLGASLVGFVLWGTLAAAPLINLRSLADRNVALGLAIKTLYSVNVYVLVALLSRYMVDLRGYQWNQTAIVFAAAVGTMLVGICAGILVGRAGNRRLRITIGLAAMTAATWRLGRVDLFTSKDWIAVVMAAWGLGAGLVVGPALLTIFARLSLTQAVQMAGVFNILRALPAFVAAAALSTMWVRTTDGYFDTLRQTVQANEPIVDQTHAHAARQFRRQGSSPSLSHDQAQATTRQWTHANARAFALQTTLRQLALLTAVALPLPWLLPRAAPRPLRTAQPVA